MRSRWFNVFVVTGLMLTSFAASAEPLSGTLEKIAKSGTFTIGVQDQMVPFSYLDDNHNVVGYTVDICRNIFQAVKAATGMPQLKLEMRTVTAQTRIALVANGAIDLDCASATNNLARQKQVAFSNTTFVAATRIAYKKSIPIKSVMDLKGQSAVAIPGTNNMEQLNQLNVKYQLGMRILSARDMAEAFLMLETGRAAALVDDDELLATYIAASKDPGAYAISTESLAPAEPYGLMMRKGDLQFKRVVDDALASYLPSSAARENYEKWFLRPIPPRAMVINLPMSPGLKKAYAQPTDSVVPGTY